MSNNEFLAPVLEQQEKQTVTLNINDFAKAIGLEPNAQGRYTFTPAHDQLAYEYAEKFARENKAQSIVIDGVASPAVIASLLHGAHPAEGNVTYMNRTPDGKMVKAQTKVLEPMPEGEGKGPEGFTFKKTETDNYTLVEFNLAGSFNVEDLDKVIPPEVDPSKPVVISGRGPLYLTHTIASAYRHYKGAPAVAFYQPASKFGPAKTEVGISHDEKYPLGLNFGEPDQINQAQEEYQNRIKETLSGLEQGLTTQKVENVEVKDSKIKITLDDGSTYYLDVRNAKMEEPKKYRVVQVDQWADGQVTESVLEEGLTKKEVDQKYQGGAVSNPDDSRLETTIKIEEMD